MAVMPPRRHDFGAHADVGAAPRRVHGVEHDQPRVIDPAVGVFEAAGEARLERLAGRRAREAMPRDAGRMLAPAKMVIEKETEADQQRRAQRRDDAAARSAAGG